MTESPKHDPISEALRVATIKHIKALMDYIEKNARQQVRAEADIRRRIGEGKQSRGPNL